MSTAVHANDMAESTPRKGVGALRLAAAVGFVLATTAFTVHSFVVSTEPWQPQPLPEIGADACQDAPDAWSLHGEDSIELSLVAPACIGSDVGSSGIGSPDLGSPRNEG